MTINQFGSFGINALPITFFVGVILFYSSLSAYAAEIPKTYTNENFWNSPHDQPVSFTQDGAGNFSGVTASGKMFTQRNVLNQVGIRLQRFAIDEAFFFVSDKGIIVATNDIMALSIYLNRSA